MDKETQDTGLNGKGPFGLRTKWTMAEFAQDQMLEDEMANDIMVEELKDILTDVE